MRRLAAAVSAVRWSRRRLFDSRLAARVTRKQPVLALGDSHVQVFQHIAKQGLLPRARIEMLRINGATALGAVNPNTPVDALPIFAQRLAEAKPFQTIVTQLGEVDCNLVIWHRAKTQGLDVDEQLEESVAAYMRFLEASGLTRIVVVSAPLPVVGDESPNARGAPDVSQRERTELTLRYNERLREECAARGIAYLDATTPQLDPATGLIRAELAGSHGDHHLNKDSYAALIVPALAVLLADAD